MTDNLRLRAEAMETETDLMIKFMVAKPGNDTGDTLTSISFAVGFTDPKYFSKVFKKETGIVPTEYRNRTQG